MRQNLVFDSSTISQRVMSAPGSRIDPSSPRFMDMPAQACSSVGMMRSSFQTVKVAKATPPHISM